jgi:phosphate transport system substrate-binding protein
MGDLISVITFLLLGSVFLGGWTGGLAEAAEGSPNPPVLEVRGAGVDLAYGLLSSWIFGAEAALAERSGTAMNFEYTPQSADDAVERLLAGEFTYAVTASPLRPAELKRAGLVQFPLANTGVAWVSQWPGSASGPIVLEGGMLASIYEGKVTSWKDPALQSKATALASPPDRRITPIFRAGRADLNRVVSSYFAAESTSWKEEYGQSVPDPWPAGVVARSDQSVAAYVASIPYSLGFVSYPLAQARQLPMVGLVGTEGDAVQLTDDSLAASLDALRYSGDGGLRAELGEVPAGGWPLPLTVYAVLPADSPNPAAARAALSLFQWGFQEGQSLSREQFFWPLPSSAQTQIQALWKKGMGSGGESVAPVGS